MKSDSRLLSQLATVAVIMMTLMTAYEWLKQTFFPDLSIWGSHIITIMFTTALATTTFYFILKQYRAAHFRNHREISRRKASEAALKESEQKWHNAVNNAVVGFYQVTGDGDFIMVNDKMARILAYDSAAELLKYIKNINQLYVDPRERLPLIRQLTAGESLNQAEVAFKDRYGQHKWISLSVRAYQGGFADMIFEGFLIDINKRKMVEAERERLYLDLKKSLDQVKTLSGLIPICSHCKKIRDDKGYWEQIEAYIMTRSEAKFSHSLCPQCAKELYPEFRSVFPSLDNLDDDNS